MHKPDLENREKDGAESSHIINIDIQDNHEDATIGAFMICDLVAMVSSVPAPEIRLFFDRDITCFVS